MAMLLGEGPARPGLEEEDQGGQVAIEHLLEELTGGELDALGPAAREFLGIIFPQGALAHIEHAGDLGVAESPHGVELDVGADIVGRHMRGLALLAGDRALAAVLKERMALGRIGAHRLDNTAAALPESNLAGGGPEGQGPAPFLPLAGPGQPLCQCRLSGGLE